MTTSDAAARAVERAEDIPSWAVALGLHDPTTVFSQWLRRFRASWGISQADLAAVLGIAEHTVYRWERGTTTPQYELSVPLNVLELRQLGAGRVLFEETMIGTFFITPTVLRDAEVLDVIRNLVLGMISRLDKEGISQLQAALAEALERSDADGEQARDHDVYPGRDEVSVPAA